VTASIWIAELSISPKVAEKLRHKQKIEENEVRLAVVCVASLKYRWDTHPEQGRRAIVEVKIRKKRALVVLYPVDEPTDTWALGSTYFI
jgi:hypothetical protein